MAAISREKGAPQPRQQGSAEKADPANAVVSEKEQLLLRLIELSTYTSLGVERRWKTVDLKQTLAEYYVDVRKVDAAKSLLAESIRDIYEHGIADRFVNAAAKIIELFAETDDFSDTSLGLIDVIVDISLGLAKNQNSAVLFLLAQVAQFMSRYDPAAAETLYMKRIALGVTHFGATSVLAAYAMHDLGDFLRDNGRHQQSWNVLENAANTYLSASGLNDWRLYGCAKSLVELAESRQDKEAAVKYWAICEEIWQSYRGKKDVFVAGWERDILDLLKPLGAPAADVLHLPNAMPDPNVSSPDLRSNHWDALLDAEQVPPHLRERMVRQLKIQLARELRPKWSDRLMRGGTLAGLSAPVFLRKVHPDLIAADGTVDNEAVIAVDPKLLKAVQQYVASRKSRSADGGDAAGLQFKPLRPATRGNLKSRRRPHDIPVI